LKDKAVSNYFDTLNATAFTLNTNLKNEIRHNINLIKAISLQQTISNEELREFTEQNLNILSIFILDSSGKITFSSDISQIGFDHSANPYFLNTNQDGYVKPIYHSKTVGKVIFSLSTPYKDGVLVARIDISNIQRIVSNIEGLGESGESLLAYRNEKGDAVFFTKRKFYTDHKAQAIIPKESIKIPITQALLGHQSEFSDYMDYRNVPVLAVTKYIKEIDAGLVVKIDKKEALRSVSESINEIWYSTIGTILAIIFIFIIFYFLLTNALRREIEKKTAEYKKAEAERSKLEEKLLQSQKMEAIGTLAGGIAHDFNNILSPIIGYTELLLAEMQENDSSRKRLNIVLNAAMRAKNLVQQILAFSRQHKTDKKPIAIQPVIKEVLTLLKSVLPSTIEIVQNVDENCGMIMADHTQLHQILMNLCTNAFQAMEATGGKLKIDLEETENRYALLTICDTGRGIEKDALKRVFEPYFTTKDQEKGTGLGLSVVHGIVKEYGGEITVYSEPGKGTIFKIHIPLIDSSEVEISTSKILSEKITGKRILLVDDEEIIISVVSEILEQSGHHVTSFNNSIQALKKFQDDPSCFDLIITDKTMPELTGLQLTTEVMKIRNDIPIILCSGFIDFDLKEAAEKTGIIAVLQKPISMKVLIQTISDTFNTES
jgi:signal transduction histidine kinase/ActR/RegA family two-component response regulator